jgi:glycosyltransferase involved in cell wall biosynthesis
MKNVISLSRRFWNVFRSSGLRAAFSLTREYLLWRGLAKQWTKRFDPHALVDQYAPIAVEVLDQQFGPIQPNSSFTLICTVLNEAEHLHEFLDSVLSQTLLPSEFVVVDGGSQDNTLKILRAYAAKSPFRTVVIESPGASIARGRNEAIQASAYEWILTVDAGSALHPSFAANMLGPTSQNSDIDLVGGIYFAAESAAHAQHFIPDWQRVDFSKFLPSARACLIRKTLWEEIGGYPEYLDKTGEDTLFDVRYRMVSNAWVFNKAAYVRWRAPNSHDEAIKLAYSYGFGDGQSGFGDFRWGNHFHATIGNRSAARNETIIEAQLAGYRAGRSSRVSVEVHSREIKGVVVILSIVPISDSGGGQRAAQLAIQFANRGYKVLFVNEYPSFEKHKKIYLPVDLSLIDLFPSNSEALVPTVATYAKNGLKPLVILEAPHEALANLADQIVSEEPGSSIVYDYIDNWDSELGGDWFSSELENSVLSRATHLMASARALADDLSVKADRTVHLVPNAVNTDLFNVEGKHERPKDLPIGFKSIALYVGALWGEWFDWDLLVGAAKKNPAVAFVLIGNYGVAQKERIPRETRNVFFLGLKEQRALPAYLANCDVCLIPFKVDDVTKYVSPLKVYEYLAMGKPVLSTYMPELVDLAGVTIATSQNDFSDHIQSGLIPVSDENLHVILREQSWGARVDKMLEFLGK